MDRAKTLETSLVHTTAFLVVYFITLNSLFLYLALAFAGVGIFIKPLAKYIAVAWFKLAEILNFVVSKIALGTLFFVVLVPVAGLYKITGNDKLQLKKSGKSCWTNRNHTYKSNDLANIW